MANNKNFLIATLIMGIALIAVNAAQSFDQSEPVLGSELREPVGITNWLNSKPLSRKDLAGKVVAIDFYTSGCSNCRAAVPHVVDLYSKYKDKGFVAIGIHTPELDYEHNVDFIRSTARQLNINYPIAVDDKGATWSAYGNRYWPNILIFNREGKLTFKHAGEGAYEEIENAVKKSL